MPRSQVKKRLSKDVLLERYTARIFNLMMEGFTTGRDIRAKNKRIRDNCTESDVNNIINIIKRDWEPLNREEREKLRVELLQQAEYMKRKAYRTIDEADKPTEIKELLNTLLKINAQIADLVGITGAARGGKEGDIYINQSDNRKVTINVEKWTEDDLKKAKKIIALKNSMNAVPEISEVIDVD